MDAKQCKELSKQLWYCAGEMGAEGYAGLLGKAAEAIDHLCAINAAAEAKCKLLTLAKLTAEAERLYKELSEHWFEDAYSWSADEVYYNCTIDGDDLKDAEGNVLSSDGRCMDEPMGYFVNQCCGYCEDDYYGTMFVSVDDKGTFVAVSYQC